MMALRWVIVAQLVLVGGRFSHALLSPSSSASTRNSGILTARRTQMMSEQEPQRTGSSRNVRTLEHSPTGRKKWGVDKDRDDEYWFNEKIHTLGNTGFFGAIHAALAPISTKMIDEVAYKGEDIRESAAKELATMIHASKARVLDLCCGVGISTRALQKAFPDAETVIGVDTSPEMISMASFIDKHDSILNPVIDGFNYFMSGLVHAFHHKSRQAKVAWGRASKSVTKFMKGNAEHTPFKKGSFDLVTIMYAFHEAPPEGRSRMLHEARRLLHRGGMLCLLDISPEYTPSASMLAGEPYVQEYQKNIQRQIRSVQGFSKTTYKTLVPGHVGCWILKRE